jgi:uncharacterized YigZ family protein
MSADHYRTAAARAESRLKVERSDFLAIAFPVPTEEEFFAALRAIEKQHFDATHHCWAFRLFDPPRARSADAGEPSGSAGKPILSAIEGADLFDIGVVVVRWFGGVKLGTGGLARAYRESAAATLRSLTLADRYLYDRFLVTVPFDMLSLAYRLVSPPDVVLENESFTDTNEFTFAVRRSHAELFARHLTERRLAFIPR